MPIFAGARIELRRDRSDGCDVDRKIRGIAQYLETKGRPYLSCEVVYTFRMFELKPHNRLAAASLLALLPPDKEKEPEWHSFNGFLCQSEPLADITVLARLQGRFPRDLARAVLLVPEKMLDYVSYAYTSIQDPDNDYAVQMRMVCRAKHDSFSNAVDRLDAHDRKWFVEKIFNPDGCHALALPEAD